VLQCDQCESDNGSLLASELDITYCNRIENARGRLACTSRETKPAAKTENPDEDNNKEETQVPTVEKGPADLKNPDLEDPEENKDPDENKDPEDNKDTDDNKDTEDGKVKGDDEKNEEIINAPIADDTPLPDPNQKNDGDYTDEFEHPTDGLPPGSFRKQCTGCEYVQQGKLLACDYCKRNNGNQRYTIAIVGDCKFFVCIDGTLRCDKIHSARL